MVYLNRIYTKTGDSGETSLGDGSRVPKTSPRIIAYGAVDELNSALGCVIAMNPSPDLANQVSRIQNDLFDVGARPVCPWNRTSPSPMSHLRDRSTGDTTSEHWIDAATERLQPLTSFILPGGSPTAAQLHVARTICRRTEIEVLRLASMEKINPQVVIYLNRLRICCSS